MPRKSTAAQREAMRVYRLKNLARLTQYAKEYHARPENKAKKKERAIRYYAANPNSTRERMLKRQYGLTPDQFSGMLVRQKGRCAVCRTDTPRGQGTWHVDHCHDSLKVRGLLCHYCNVGLGNLKDSPRILRAAIRYLKRSSA